MATASGAFNIVPFTPRGGGYGVQQGSYHVADVSGDGRSDIVHLCCSNYVETWVSNGNGSFNLPGAWQPWQNYGVQYGQWLTGRFDFSTGSQDLIHICCTNTVNVWRSNGNGTYSVINGWSPWPNYGMLDGSWHAADFTGDGRTDILHAVGPNHENTWKARINNSGMFDVTVYIPGGGYCMLC